ncbi:MAG: GNAT family N-acetyltransferase [Synergistaceae bacterium]|nr:GNAT family N-acetyltransferase [Synergistaceae bacterium]
MPLLKSENIFLRPVVPDDVRSSYGQWLNDPEINSFLETRFITWTPDLIEEYVVSMARSKNEFFFAICYGSEGVHVGNIKVGPIMWNHRNADISLIIGEKAFWGKGIATEAIRLVVEYSFVELDLLKLKSGCYSSNKASVRAFEKNHFIREGLLRSHCWSRGKREDIVIFGLTRCDYDKIGSFS